MALHLRVRCIFFCLKLCVLPLTGCGSDDSGQSPAGPTVPQSADATGEELSLPTPVETDPEMELSIETEILENENERYIQFSLRAVMPNGRTQTIRQQADWSSSNEEILAINELGQALIGRPGETEIAATFEGQTLRTKVTIPRAALSTSP